MKTKIEFLKQHNRAVQNKTCSVSFPSQVQTHWLLLCNSVQRPDWSSAGNCRSLAVSGNSHCVIITTTVSDIIYYCAVQRIKKQWKLFRNVSFSDKTNRVKLDNGICRIKLIKTMFKRTLKLQKKLLLVMLPMIKPVQWQKWFTYKYSKCIWSQFLEDDWVGWSVSLEYLRRSNRNILEYNSLFCKNVFFNKVYIAMSIHVTGGHCPPNTRYSWKVFGGVNFFSCYNDLTLIWTKIRSLV